MGCYLWWINFLAISIIKEMIIIEKINDKLRYGYSVILAQGVTLENPIGANDFETLVSNIAVWVRRISIPIAVIFIVFAGIKFITSQGNPEKIIAAKRMLLWTVVGLAIIFIGGGFISLIRSILSLN